MINRMCIYITHDRNEPVRHFSVKLAEALQRRRIVASTINYKGHIFSFGIYAIPVRRYAPDLTCSYIYLASYNASDFMWDVLQTPHLFMLVDPPFFVPNLLKSSHLVISTVDRGDEAWIRSQGFDRTFFFPHAVEREMAPDPDPHAERPYEVVMIGSCTDYKGIRKEWQEKLSKPLGKMLDDGIDLFFASDTMSVYQALMTVWKESLLEKDKSEIEMLKQCYYYIDRYIRGYDRVQLIRSIKNAKVHIFCGSFDWDKHPFFKMGWSDYLGSQPNVVLHPHIPYYEVPAIMRQSKILLNSMPFFRDGSHERVFLALACGCLPVNSESKYLREEFRDGDEIMFYQSYQRDAVSPMIDALLADEKRRAEGAERGRQKVMQRHTWDNRVDILIKELPPLIKMIKEADDHSSLKDGGRGGGSAC